MKLYAVRTDDRTGLAKFGTITVTNLKSFSLEPQDDVLKAAGDAADPHHPNKPVLLTIGKGSHSITVPSEDGKSEITLTLTAGNRILFCDFSPKVPPASNRRFCYSGHWSVPGENGATLSPAIVQNDVDLDSLGWEDYIP